jgi:hypothetical protein
LLCALTFYISTSGDTVLVNFLPYNFFLTTCDRQVLPDAYDSRDEANGLRSSDGASVVATVPSQVVEMPQSATDGFAPATTQVYDTTSSRRVVAVAAADDGGDVAGSIDSQTVPVVTGRIVGVNPAVVKSPERREGTGFLPRGGLDSVGTHVRFHADDSSEDDEPVVSVKPNDVSAVVRKRADYISNDLDGSSLQGHCFQSGDDDATMLFSSSLRENEDVGDGSSPAAVVATPSTTATATTASTPELVAVGNSAQAGSSVLQLRKYWRQRYSLFRLFDKGAHKQNTSTLIFIFFCSFAIERVSTVSSEHY